MKTLELIQQRIQRGKESTLSTLRIAGALLADYYQLEDEDRNLTSTMTLAAIAKVKVFGRTAIPTGRYRMMWTYSNRFKKYTWELIGVPGYSGIRFHKGNLIVHTDGCQLPGTTFDVDKLGYLRVWSSGVALDRLEALLEPHRKAGTEIWYTIKQSY